MNYTEVEAKVREATNDDQWGPHGSLMNDIAKYTFMYESFPEVMGMLWKRMLIEKKNWRRTYKSLLLLHYLLRNGSERVVTSTRDHLYDMRQLESYQFTDENGKDQGLNVRHKAKELIDFVQDNDRLRQERKRAKQNREKYVGLSSDVVSDGFYSDRYDKEPSSIRSRDEFDAMDLQRKSKLGEFKDKIGQKLNEIRPGRRDYKDYQEKSWDKGRNAYKDEPEDGEEVSEDKEAADEDIFSYRSSKSSSSKFSSSDLGSELDKPDTPTPTPAPTQTRQPVRKIDLGAAASLVNVPKPAASEPRENGTSVSTVPITTATAPSAMNDLVDLMSAGPTDPPLLPMNTAPEQDLFGGFSSAPTPAETNNGQFADFGAFNSSKPAEDDTDFGDFSSFGTNVTPASQTTTSLQGLDFLSSPSAVQTTPTPSSFQAGLAPTGFSQTISPPLANQNTLAANPVRSSGLDFLSSPSAVQTTPTPSSFQAGLAPTGFSQTISPPLANQNTLAANPVRSSGVSPKEKTSMWSNTGLDISLDTLSPISAKDKPIQPSMNQMTNQQAAVGHMTMNAPIGMQPSSMGSLNAGISNMVIGSGMTRPGQTGQMQQPMSYPQMGGQMIGSQIGGMMGSQPMVSQPMVSQPMVSQPMGSQPMGGQSMGQMRSQQMTFGMQGSNMAGMANQGMLGNQNMGMQFGYQQMGMGMQMPAQYQTPMQGTMGQFRS
eukprot:gene11931-2499_t